MKLKRSCEFLKSGGNLMQKKVLITGAAKRIGAACARLLHGEGCNVFLHYRS